MTMRRAKQLIYGTLYLIILAGIVWGVRTLFFRPVASCFDGLQDQGEAGVDCGGPCAKLCTPAAFADIAVLGNVSVFNPYPHLSSLPQHYAVLARVANPNAEFGTENFSYTFNLYDAAGNLLQSLPGQSFIYAGEVKYLIAPNVAVGGVVDHATLAVAPLATSSWTPTSSMGTVPQFGNPLAITGSSVSSSTAPGGGAGAGMLAVTGRITDADASVFANILIVAIFYDDAGNPVGASETTLDGIVPNQTENFSVAYPAVPGIVPALTKAYAYALR